MLFGDKGRSHLRLCTTARCECMTAFVWRIPDFGKKTVYGDSEREGHRNHGRSRDLQRNLAGGTWFLNKVVGKAQLGDLIWSCYKVCGHEQNGRDARQTEGSSASAKRLAPVCSIGIDDMIIPKEKGQEIEPRRSRSATSRSSIAKVSSRRANATTRSSISGRIAPTRSANVMLKTLDAQPGQARIQPHLADGGFRRAR